MPRARTLSALLAAFVLVPALVTGSAAAPAAGGGRADSVYAWPLAVPPELTSTFGEYRPGHFHAGIDLSTFGREGLPARAVEVGQVVRVRAGARGYGRAVYLRLRDGRLAVYGHLGRFMPALADYVADIQEERRTYRVDLYPPPGRFPVRRGQVVGWTGSSGAGGPHLHFELREGDIAINPLSHGLLASDHHPPTLRAVVLSPMDERARIDGAARRLRLPLARHGGELTAPRTVDLWGRVQVGIDCFDRAGERASRLAPYRVELAADGRVLVHTVFDRFAYQHNHEVLAEFDLDAVAAGRHTVLNLFATPGITGDFHLPWEGGAGVLVAGPADSTGAEGASTALAPGPHSLTIRVADACGQQTTAVVRVRVARPPGAREPGAGALPVEVPGPADGARPARCEVELEPGPRLAIATVAWETPLAGPPAGWLGGQRLDPPEMVDARHSRFLLPASGAGPLVLRAVDVEGSLRGWSGALGWAPVPRAAPLEYWSPDGVARLRLPVRAFFEPAYIWAHAAAPPGSLAAALPPGLEAVTPLYRVEPATRPLDRRVTIGLRLPAGAAAARVALYRLEEGEHAWEGQQLDANARLVSGSVLRLGRFFLARDVAPPRLEPLAPAAGQLLDDARPRFRAVVEDRESGLDEAQVQFRIDGRAVPTEWDPEAHRMRYRPRRPLAPGAHAVELRAVDRAGNVTAVTIAFRIEP